MSLSHLHQSSLGTLLTIVPLKVDPRWWSELLPATFLVSSYMAGTIARKRSSTCSQPGYLRLKPRVDLLGGLARFQIGLIIVFLTLRISDLVFLRRDRLRAGIRLAVASRSGAELVRRLPRPARALLDPRRPARTSGLSSARRVCWLGGILLTRLNTAVFGMRVKHWESYFPSLGEFATTFGVLAGSRSRLRSGAAPPSDPPRGAPRVRGAAGVGSLARVHAAHRGGDRVDGRGWKRAHGHARRFRRRGARQPGSVGLPARPGGAHSRAGRRTLASQLASKQDVAMLQPIRINEILEQRCVRCHTDRRFAKLNGMTRPEILETIQRMSEHPGSNIPADAVREIEAALLVFRCTACHGEGVLSEILLMPPDERVRFLRTKVQMPDSGFRMDQIGELMEAFDTLAGRPRS